METLALRAREAERPVKASARAGGPALGLALGLVLAAVPAFAQIGDGTTFVSGLVADEKGYALRNVIVAAEGSDGASPAADTTDADGRFGPGKGPVVSLSRARAAAGPALRGSSLRFAGLPRGSTLRVELLLASGRRAGTSASLPSHGGRVDLDLDALAAGLPREGLYVLRADDGQSAAHHLLARVGGGSWVLSSQGHATPEASGSPALRKSARALPATVTLRKPGYKDLVVTVPEGGDIGKAVLKLDAAAAVVQAPFDVAPLWYPSGWAGDVHGIKTAEEREMARPGDPDGKCQKWSFTPTPADDSALHAPPTWAAVLWQYPANNWGAKPGRRVIGARKVSFWARGATGKESLEFKTGSDTYYQPPEPKLYKDTFGNSLRETLSTEWRRYEIPLDGLNTEQVISSFVWAATSEGNAPVTFWIDELRFE